MSGNDAEERPATPTYVRLKMRDLTRFRGDKMDRYMILPRGDEGVPSDLVLPLDQEVEVIVDDSRTQIYQKSLNTLLQDTKQG